ncbi:MAG: hypothetical protein R2795_03010 [Saprospiraceae bacterium]
MASAREIGDGSRVMASALHLFELEGTRRGRRWGSKNWFDDGTQASMLLPVYAKSAGKALIEIFADDHLLYSKEAQLAAGLNYPTYPFTYTKTAWPAYKQWLEKQQKEDDELPNLEPADDGQYYLQKGKYKVVVSKDGVRSEQTFEIK